MTESNLGWLILAGLICIAGGSKAATKYCGAAIVITCILAWLWKFHP